MKIDHIAMYVKDLEKAKGFFIKYFDGHSNDIYTNPKTGFSSYFLTFSDGSRLELMKKPGIKETSKENEEMGYVHLAFSVGSKEKVDSLTSQLVNDGFNIISGPRTTGDGYYESCIVGIEDNLIEITV